MASCANHTWVETAEQCQACRRPLCVSCLVDFLGGRFCGPCRDQRLFEIQSRGRRPVLKPKGSAQEGLSPQAQRFFGMVVALLALPMLLALALIQKLGPSGAEPLELGVGAIGIALAMVVAAVGAERFALLGNKGRRRKAAEKIAGMGAVQAAQNGLFVGLAPTAERRAYQGDSSWDYGFLVVEPGWSVYYGEKTQFGLRPDQVESLEIQPRRQKSILVDSRLLVRWRDPATGAADAIRLSVPDFRTRAESRVKLGELQALLESWRQAPAPTAGSLRLPPVGFAEGTRVKPYSWEPLHSYRQLVILVVILGSLMSFVFWDAFGWNVAPFVTCLVVLALLATLTWLVDVVRLRNAGPDA